MITKTKLKNKKAALKEMETAFKKGGIEKLHRLLAEYAADVANADIDERDIAGGNAIKITMAIAQLPRTFRTEALAFWAFSSKLAVGLSDAKLGVSELSKDKQIDKFVEGIMELKPNPDEAVPLSLFCPSFQIWATLAELSIKTTLKAAYNVSVYKAAEKERIDICLIAIAPEQGAVSSVSPMPELRIVVPETCINREEHFVSDHEQAFNEQVAAFIAKHQGFKA